MVKTFTIKAKVWVFAGKAAWSFVTLPKKDTEDIRFLFAHVKRGWGSLPVVVTVGKTTWKTSIFPDKDSRSYVLPLKAEVRKKENIKKGDMLSLSLEIKD
jgi:hypothetical protein